MENFAICRVFKWPFPAFLSTGFSEWSLRFPTGFWYKFVSIVCTVVKRRANIQLDNIIMGWGEVESDEYANILPSRRYTMV